MHRFVALRIIPILLLLIFANSIFLFGQPDSIYRLPAGTRFVLKLDAEINSAVSSVDDTFIAAVAKPVTLRGTVILPVGTVIEGRVTRVSRAANLGRAGKLYVVFEKLIIAGQARHIDGVMTAEIAAPSSRGMTFLSILGGAAAGGILGAASKTNNASLIGAGIGTAAGLSVAFLRKGKEARLPKDQEFEIELKKEVLLPVIDY